MKQHHRLLRAAFAGATLWVGLMATAPTRAEDQYQPTADRNAMVRALRRQAPELWSVPLLLEQVLKGFETSPVPLKLAGGNLALIGYGSYIVNVESACGDCHSNLLYAPGGDPRKGEKKQFNVAGYLGGGQAFGPVVSRNLTPENGLPGGRSYAEFQQIMRTGIDLDHAHPDLGPLLQVMPWPVYQEMPETSLRAIYAYLRAIPPVQAPAAQ